MVVRLGSDSRVPLHPPKGYASYGVQANRTSILEYRENSRSIRYFAYRIRTRIFVLTSSKRQPTFSNECRRDYELLFVRDKVLRAEQSCRTQSVARAALGLDQVPIDAELVAQPLHEDLQAPAVTFARAAPEFRAGDVA